MSWENILKIETYIKMRITTLKKELKGEKDPEKRKLIEGNIAYWERIKEAKE